jgi:hypothetical protein
MYNEVEQSSPFEWGFPDWEMLTVEGVSQTRILDVFQALAVCGRLSNNALVVDKKEFNKACKPMHTARMTLEKFTEMGLFIESLEDKKTQTFEVTCPSTPNLIKVIYAYFTHQKNDKEYHKKFFSYRYVEATEKSSQETFYLAYTEGTPKEVRIIYDYLHDEAAKHGYLFQGCLEQGGLLYKKGGKIWLLAGSGSSYHEVDYLCSPDYEIAVKVQFKRIFNTLSYIKEELTNRFPQAIYRKRSTCWGCREVCAKRVFFVVEGKEKHCCNTFVFANPTLDDVKYLLDLYKEEHKIK